MANSSKRNNDMTSVDDALARARKAESEAAVLSAALDVAYKTFERYAHMHAEKGTEDGRRKSEANMELATQCFRALDSTTAGARMLQQLNEQTVQIAALQEMLNTPLFDDFTEAVKREAAHQVQRWGKAHDRSKSAENWYWLVGYLSGKALRAAIDGDREKALHHTISSAAALMQWHASIKSDPTGCGLGEDEDLKAKEAS